MASGFRQKQTKMCIIVILVGSWECTRLVADKREQTCVFLYFSIMVGDLSLTDASKHVFPYTSRFGECGFVRDLLFLCVACGFGLHRFGIHQYHHASAFHLQFLVNAWNLELDLHV